MRIQAFTGFLQKVSGLLLQKFKYELCVLVIIILMKGVFPLTHAVKGMGYGKKCRYACPPNHLFLKYFLISFNDKILFGFRLPLKTSIATACALDFLPIILNLIIFESILG